ncbi:apolipoprotein N-acyltransferase [Marisediminicola senii]|uniref:apolipoprotein N-acyltransferase n=1 Tax=Marisediminicola senii TaxID=2711233 RepID=UPI0013EAC072|nr:apolipoprotein N-acyltransferase [Marisediminicola senii]
MIDVARVDAAPGRTASRPLLPLSIATFTGVIGGIANAAAFPGLGWWPLIFVGTPLILASLVGRRFWGSLLVGLLAGFAFWGTHIFWLTIYLGAVPWLALAGLETIFFALGCVLISLAWRWGQRAFPSAWGRRALVPVLVAALWMTREYVSSTWPYGGFSWGRLAFSQSESPFGSLASWVGVSGLTFLIALVSALIVQAVRELSRRRLLLAAPAALLLVMLLVPTFPVAYSGTARIAAVQGNSNAGLFAEYERGEILQNHLDATEPLYGDDVDLVVWPENAADIDPLREPFAASALDRVTDQLSAPLVAGTFTVDGDDIYNSVLLWENGTGAVDQYDKINPVPFAEYIPDRDFWYPLAPELLSLIPRDYSIGTRDNIVELVGDSGQAIVGGVAICFDIVSDASMRQMIDDGANIILAPTNNADFGQSDESVQQLAIARMRAIETGRSVVNTSTVGTSAIIAPDGSTIDRLPTFEPGSMVEDVPLSTTTTAATAIGRELELAIVGLGLLGLAAAGVLARRAARAGGRSRA